ncbi:GATA zinc finger domain-containing protein 9 [Vanrija pseudolonga]|uniref:GATA zinc finger domain-containing protein 9 n=1 Tax=Vanrija pseudolonga TaxID=143232 RepID=A0AAF1BNU5_9TREE|nr:GATA zinc finger domain-containing protein 9 [Vanrija pseudolonga]
MRRINEWAPSYETQVDQLDKYINELISLMEPFSATPSNPSPAPPPPYLHTRLARLATLVRETLATLETSSQPALSIEFLRLPPGNEPPTGEDMTEAEREMELIRRRREVLNTKAQQGKRVGGTPVPPRPPGQPMFQGRPGPAPLAPRPNRDVWRCHGCGTTVCDEWRDGPDGPQSLCVNCGYHYDRLVRKREGGDPDFSTVPAPGYNPDLLGSLNGL